VAHAPIPEPLEIECHGWLQYFHCRRYDKNEYNTRKEIRAGETSIVFTFEKTKKLLTTIYSGVVKINGE
jgi:hypothetical protein